MSIKIYIKNKGGTINICNLLKYMKPYIILLLKQMFNFIYLLNYLFK